MKEIIKIFIKNHYSLRKIPIVINGDEIDLNIVKNPICVKCLNRMCIAEERKKKRLFARKKFPHTIFS